VEDEYNAARNQSEYHAGSAGNPFWVDESEEDKPTGNISALHYDHTGSDSMQSSPPPAPSPPLQSSPLHAPPPTNPSSSTPQRLKPKGILLGTWKHAGLPAGTPANAVYGSRDKKNRINRRVVKVDSSGTMVLGGHYDVKKTSCSHKNIDYLPQFAGMSKGEVDSHIMPLLIAMDASARSRSVSPAAAAAMRRAKRARQTASSTFTGAEGGFSNRGGRFFVAEDGSTYDSLA